MVATKVNKNRPLAFKNVCPFKLKVCAQNYKTEGALLKDSGFGLDQRVQQTADHGLNPTYHLFLYSPQVKWFLHFRMIGEKIISQGPTITWPTQVLFLCSLLFAKAEVARVRH